jgi:hypothetical protein
MMVQEGNAGNGGTLHLRGIADLPVDAAQLSRFSFSLFASTVIGPRSLPCETVHDRVNQRAKMALPPVHL